MQRNIKGRSHRDGIQIIMNKLPSLLFVVVLSGCSSEPQVHSTTEPMYFICGNTKHLPAIVDIRLKSIYLYHKNINKLVKWIDDGTYYYDFNYETNRLDYKLSGTARFDDNKYISVGWTQLASGDYITIDKNVLTCDRVNNHDAYFGK